MRQLFVYLVDLGFSVISHLAWTESGSRGLQKQSDQTVNGSITTLRRF